MYLFTNQEWLIQPNGHVMSKIVARPFGKHYLKALCLCLFIIGLTSSSVISQAVVTTDKPDYAPRSNAVFTGSGFQPGESVILKVKNLSRACNTISADSSYLPWMVTADGNGEFVTHWIVCDCPGDSLRLKATGQQSGLIATAYFTDAVWKLTADQTVCAGIKSTLTLTVIPIAGAPSNPSGLFKINFPASFTLSNPVITNVVGGTGWSVSLSGQVICLNTDGTGNDPDLDVNDYLVFTIDVVPASPGAFLLSGFSAGNNKNCTETSGVDLLPSNAPTITVSSPTTITCPPTLNLSGCNPAIPAGATTVAAFVALGGTTTGTSISYSDGVPSVSGCTETTIRTYTASGNGCSISCNQTITRKVDQTKPTVTAGNIASCYATVAAAEAAAIAATSSSDNCTGPLTTTASTVGDCSAVITVKVEDGCGNFDVVTYNTRIDNTKPTVTAGNIASCYATVAAAEAAAIAATSSSDNCTGDLTTTASTVGECSAVITVKVQDGCGNFDVVTYNTRIDNTKPTVTAGNIASCYATVAAAEAAAIAATGSSDNCTGPLTTTASTVGDCSAVITVKVEDGCGNFDVVTYNTRIDNTKPTVTAGNIASCYAIVAAAEAAAIAATNSSDNCTGALTTTASTVGDCSAVITVKVEDGCGNFDVVTYNTRIDNTKPTVTAGNIASCYATVAAAEAAAIAATSSSDNCTGALTTTASTVGDCSAVITVKLEDGCGNFDVVTYNTRIDNTKPTVTAGNIASCYATVAAAEAAAIAATSSSDNCTGALTTTASTVGDCSAVITVKVQDGCGNFDVVTYNTRIDNTKPTVTAGNIGSCYATVAAAEAAAIAATTSSDNCTGALTTTASTVGDCSAVITVKVQDGCGNFDVVTYNTRIDNTAPVPPSAPAAVNYSCLADVPAPGSLTAQDNCSGAITVTGSDSNNGGTGCSNNPLVITRTWTFTDECGNSKSISQTITVVDNSGPSIPAQFVSQTSLWPPNHKMVDIYLDASDNCGLTAKNVVITSNEPVNDIGDGNTDPDWWIDPNNPLHIQLRAERSGVQALVLPDIGRIYTITLTVSDACGNSSTGTNTVTVAHNITGPVSGNSFKIGTTVNLAGTFWDVPGNKHTAKWLVAGTTIAGTIVAEPSGNKVGKVGGSFKPTVAGVYKLQMNVIDQKGFTSYANTNGDLDAYFVAYDPTGGYTYGGGKFSTKAGSMPGKKDKSGKVSFGFTSNYFKNATNPKGETVLNFKNGDLEFIALNFDYLAVNGPRAIYKGSGKITDGQSGLYFIMSVIDGQATGGGGVDKIRLKIYNKNTGEVIFDNQPGDPETADPTTPVDTGGEIVVVSTTSTKAKKDIETVSEPLPPKLEVQVLNNPSAGNTAFRLKLSSNNQTDVIQLRIMDGTGKPVESRHAILPGQTIEVGRTYVSGLYFAEAIQGSQRVVVKLIRQ